MVGTKGHSGGAREGAGRPKETVRVKIPKKHKVKGVILLTTYTDDAGMVWEVETKRRLKDGKIIVTKVETLQGTDQKITTIYEDGVQVKQFDNWSD